jgi:A/G-specific adenine glycosylase
MTPIDTFQTALLDWATDNTREYPWREQGRSLYEVFLAEFLLTQTPADNVATVYPELIEKYPSLDAIRRADEDVLRESIEPLGFQNIGSVEILRN